MQQIIIMLRFIKTKTSPKYIIRNSISSTNYVCMIAAVKIKYLITEV